MRTVTVNSYADLLWLKNDRDVFVRFGRGIIDIPTITPLSGLRNVHFDGTSGPKGRVAFYGAPLQFFDCQGLCFDRIAFHMSKPPTMQQERSWGLRFLSSIDNISDITLRSCSIRGNTDETAFRGVDGVPITRTNGSRVQIDSCMIGPSCVSTDPQRGNHNYGLAFTGIDYVTVRGSVFGGHHRRLVQLRGQHGLIAGNMFVDWGSMCIGLHGGTSCDVRSNIYWRGPAHTPARVKPVMPVGGTEATFGNRIALKLDNWSSWATLPNEPIELDKTWRGESVVEYMPNVNTLPLSVGVGDSLDRYMSAKVAMRNVPWELECKIVRGDYE